jgi:hypothetical protein
MAYVIAQASAMGHSRSLPLLYDTAEQKQDEQDGEKGEQESVS